MTKANEQMKETAQINYRYICTIDSSTFEGKRAIVNARNTALSLNSIDNTPITIIGVCTAPGVRSQNGQKCVNVYLFANDGKTYFSQSQGIYRSVLDIYDMFPDFNAPDGILVTVKETSLGGGRSTKSLEIK